MTAFQWGLVAGTVLCAVRIKKVGQTTFNRAYSDRMAELKAEEDKKK